jgi:hypothetical protein
MTTKSQRGVVVMQPGPLHLFWTTGVFYLWVLKNRFGFYLIVPDTYKTDLLFQQIAKLSEVVGIAYLPSAGFISRHSEYSYTIKNVLSEIRPSYILMHNWSYVHNQYLLYWSKKYWPNVSRHCYQNGREAVCWEEDFRNRIALHVEKIVSRYPLFRKYYEGISTLFKLRQKAFYFINYKVIPSILLRYTFTPPVNIYNGTINLHAGPSLSSLDDNDFLLAYLDAEIDTHKSLGVRNIRKVAHPVSSACQDIFKLIFDSIEETNSILLVPSYGFTSRLIAEGWSQDEVIDWVANRWCGAISKLQDKFPNYSMKLKLHPATSADSVWIKIVEVVRNRTPTLILLSSTEIAEKHVTQSKVVVGDVSSVLWWASFLKGKITISFDIFSYPGGDEMKHYRPFVSYINHLDKDLEIHADSRECDAQCINEIFS